MRVPTDKSLRAWILELIDEGRLYRFYKTQEWLELRDKVLRDAHYECEDCAARGKYTRAKLVHHDHEVRDYPAEALSTYWVDAQGTRHKQLWALCQDCHEVRHNRAYRGRFGISDKKAAEIAARFPERW